MHQPTRQGLLRWLPLALGGGGAVLALLLWQALAAQEDAHIARTLQMKTAAVSEDVGHALDSRIQALDRMVRRWEMRGRPGRKEWESDAALYLKHYPGYRAIAWADPALDVRWVVPRAGNGAGPGLGLGTEERQRTAAQTARRSRGATITRPLGAGAFAAFLPIYSDNGFDGFIVGAFQGRELFDAILRADAKHEGYAIAIADGAEELYLSGDGRGELKWVREAEIKSYGAAWRVRVWPNAGHLAQLRSPLPEVTLTMGIVMALLLALAAYFAMKAWFKEQEVEAVNRELVHENAERRRAEEAVARHAADLERSNAELQQFAYVASHDLQEPLRIVAGYVQLLARRYQGRLDAEADEFIAFAVDGATRMQGLISDLLTYSRVGSRGRAFEPVRCEDVLKQSLASLKLMIEESRATVTHDPLPTVTADAGQLHQLFLNLISNAVKYRGGTPPAIHIAAADRADAWQFSVRDNGIGIDPKYFERIFVIFQRLHGKDEYPGTGIGLAISKKVVENHGGRIWVESQVGKGATFYFTISKNLGRKQ